MAMSAFRSEGSRYIVTPLIHCPAPLPAGRSSSIIVPNEEQTLHGVRSISPQIVRNRMKSVKNIQKITKAMKMVAASKLRAIQSNAENSRGLWQPFTALLGDTPTAVLSKTSHFLAKSSVYGGASWKRSLECAAGTRTSSNFDFSLTRFRVQCYSAKTDTGTAKMRSRKPKAKPPVVVDDRDDFFVVRKGDLVGVYKSFSDCQAQAGSSVCDPPVSIFKGYRMPKDTEEYLRSRGLKNPLYTIRADALKQDLFGLLLPCPYQLPESTIAEISIEDASKQKISEEGTVGPETMSTDVSKKDDESGGAVELQVPISDLRTCFLEFDGASKGNPGQAGAGAVLRYDNGTVICRLRQGLGTATNNVAEYQALILGLKCALEKGFTSVCAKGDSSLIVFLVQGLWKAKAKNMIDLHKEADKLKKEFDSFKISHVLRAFNSEADAQANLGVALADGVIEEETEDND